MNPGEIETTVGFLPDAKDIANRIKKDLKKIRKLIPGNPDVSLQIKRNKTGEYSTRIQAWVGGKLLFTEGVHLNPLTSLLTSKRKFLRAIKRRKGQFRAWNKGLVLSNQHKKGA